MRDLGQMLGDWLYANGETNVSKLKIEYDWNTGESEVTITRSNIYACDDPEDLGYILSKYKLQKVET